MYGPSKFWMMVGTGPVKQRENYPDIYTPLIMEYNSGMRLLWNIISNVGTEEFSDPVIYKHT